MAIEVGTKMPAGTFKEKTAEGIRDVSTEELFSGKKVVLFSVPGAFTPTCSLKHLPGYVAHAGRIKAKGVDTIACMAVNDAFVMEAWGADQSVGDNVAMLADGSGEYTRALGLELDLTDRGLGVRGQRFAMVVDDGVLTHLAVEPNPGELNISSAEKVLEAL
ncbi:MAG: peroxiredoxin [Alphaproteobacteria bacterium]